MADTAAAANRTSDGQPALKRVMGRGLLLLFIVGDILGTGIYALTGQVAAQVGGVVWLPFLVAFLVALVTVFAVANSALINTLMASRLVYGLSRERVLPGFLGRVHSRRRTPTTAILFTTLLAFGLITVVGEVPDLGGTTALLLLAVFAVVNVAVLVLRRDSVDADHFRTPTVLPVVGALACAFLATPWAGRPTVQYQIAGVLLGIGVLLWLVTVLVTRRTGREPAHLDPTSLTGEGPVN